MKIRKGREDDWATWSNANSNDAYSGTALQFAEKWAEMMELWMDAGQPLCLKMAQEARTLVAIETGATSFQYGEALKAVGHCWEHGDQLLAAVEGEFRR